MNGGVIGSVNLPTIATASGVWNIEEVKLATQQGIWPPLALPDPYWENVSLLLSGTTATTNGAQNNTFLDSSTNNFSVTRSGNTTQGSFSPYGSNWSNYFDGSGDYLSIADSSAFAFGSSNFTIECWVFMNAAAQQFFISQWSSPQRSWGFLLSNSGTNLKFVYSTTGSNELAIDATITAQVSTWTHFAAVRNGNTIKTYMNGVEVGSGDVTGITLFDASQAIEISRNPESGSWNFNGYMSNVRVVKGTAIYTENFTPPTTPLIAVSGTSLLTCQSNRFIDNSANNFTITRNGDTFPTKFSPFGLQYQSSFSYGVYFDGDGDYLTLNSSAALAVESSDFTLELWAYFNNADSTNDHPFYTNIESSGFLSNTFYFGKHSVTSGKITLYIYNYSSSTYFIAEPTLPPANQWVHYALVRNGNTFTIYRDGIATVSASFSGAVTDSTSPCLIGRAGDGGLTDMFSGYMSNLRLVKGTAVYTSNFTPPTTQLTAITNTSLLACQSNTIIDNSTNNFTITVYGNTAPTSFSPFTNTYTTITTYNASILGSSGYFDGTGDYLTIPYSQSIVQWWDTDYTIEMWVRNTLNRETGLGVPTQIAYGVPTTDITYWSFGTNGTGRLYFYYFNGGQVVNAVSPEAVTVPLNVWTHIAMVYNNTTGNLNGYINGKLAFSVAKQGTPQGASGFTLNIGAVQNVSYNGYISSIRIVSGTAVYTNDFVPLLTPLTAIPNTQLLCNFANAGILDSSTINDLETVGNAQVATAVKKYGTGSVYFDGNGDSLLAPYDINYQLGTGDFTVELWINASASGSYTQIVGTQGAGADDGVWRIGNRFNSNNQVYFARGNGSGFDEVIYNVNVNDGNWHHIACVRVSGTISMYIDGTLRTPSSGSTAISGTCSSAFPLHLGNNPRDSAFLAGYISDLRITKGVARYTTNFTPPTSSLPTF